MNDSIKISPKYGVNPTMPICFFCGEETGEIALLGLIRKKDENGKIIKGSDIEAPKHMILDYQPCDKCKANMELGMTIIEVTDSSYDTNTREICPGAIPTGSWNVIKMEAFERIFKDMLPEQAYENALKTRKLLLDAKVFSKIFQSNS